MANVYIATERNGLRGVLLSMAMVTVDGLEFYEVIGRPWRDYTPDDDVYLYVMPEFNKEPIDYEDFKNKFKVFLSNTIDPVFIAAYPLDIESFCAVLSNIQSDPLPHVKKTSFIINKPISASSTHNALINAHELMNKTEEK